MAASGSSSSVSEGVEQPGCGQPARAPWWSARSALLRFVADLVAGELAALRHDPQLDGGAWTEALSLHEDLALDSLELLHVASSLSAALQMHHSGVEDYLLMRRTLGEWVDIATLALRHRDDALSFSTSGSTGQPKRCIHALASLEQEAQALAALFPGRRRLLVAVPAHHIYGFLCSVLLPRHLGLEASQVVSVRARLPGQLARMAAPGDLVIGHPQFWHAAVAEGAPFADDVVGVSSTAPCPDAVALAAERAGLTKLFQLYGSSETAGLGWRGSHRDPYRLHPYLARDPRHERGVQRWLATSTDLLQAQDALTWRDAEHFVVGERCDGAVQVGGVNVFPAQVRLALLEHPEVADAAVRLMRPDEGIRLKAFVVPRDPAQGGAALAERLRAWTDTRLATAERPKAFSFGTTLPRSAMGKPADWTIA